MTRRILRALAITALLAAVPTLAYAASTDSAAACGCPLCAHGQ